jgi:8-hydroxy-5-deazaflavin:NADPH oxidoreductase
MLFLIVPQWRRPFDDSMFALSNNGMRTKRTIAIIGLGSIGKGLAAALSAGTDRVLLFDKKPQEATSLASALAQSHPAFDVEALTCSADACWEADFIILDVSPNELAEVGNYIKPYANQKIVVSTIGEAGGTSIAELKQLLPFSKIARAFHTIQPATLTEPGAGTNKECQVEGEDAEAVATVKELIQQIGYTPVCTALKEAAPHDDTIQVV